MIEIQKHLTLARERIAELESDMIEQSERHKKHIKHIEGKLSALDASTWYGILRYRIGITLLVVLTGYLGYNNMKYAAENRWFASESTKVQERFDNILEMLNIQNMRVLELEEANEQLIRHCRPCDVKKAIKATPLPSRMRV